MNRTPMTAQGAERLRAELQSLKTTDRPLIIREIAEARSHGDLRENAEYHAAKERQGFIEGRIAEIENALSRAEVIDTSRVDAGGRIVFGARVELVNIESDEEVTYRIVGDLEADIDEGLISVSSPTARALIGREPGDEVTVRAPGGDLTYEVLGVEYS